ncbi:MAG: TylF/MycF/NovP-related O-methyltransferase [Caulobacteraceae bacterium]
MSDKDLIGHRSRLTVQEEEAKRFLQRALASGGVPTDELIDQLNLFSTHIALGKTLFVEHLYRQILDVPGVIFEFGVRWGQNMALMTKLRALLEPYNHLRRIVGFDTFSGFPSVAAEDAGPYANLGGYSVNAGWKDVLGGILQAHEQQQPIPQIEKHELVEGDVRDTLDAYLQARPETVIALAYFDFDIYEPTLFALQKIRPYLTKGSIVAFDELCHPRFPGETVALRDTLQLGDIRLRRMPYTTNPAYFVVGE